MKRGEGIFEYLAGSREVVLEGEIPYGRGKSRCQLVVPVDTMCSLADAIRVVPQEHWGGALWDIKHGRPVRALGGTADHRARIRAASREELAALVEQIADTLFPDGDAGHEGGSAEIGDVVNHMQRAGFAPAPKDS